MDLKRVKMRLYNLFKKKVFHIEPDLNRIRNALKELGSPQNYFQSILISGTNGKGSTAAFIESILRHHNIKTGLFTSPHLIDERERWIVNGSMISDDELSFYIKDLKKIFEKYNLTYFEASTVICFKYFKDKKIDTAVLEVGLGGRWDATNVVYPEVSVITNVSLDHTKLLGSTKIEIAKEKLGIARKDRPLVIGSDQIEIISQAVMMGIKEIYHYPIGFTYQIAKDSMIYHFKGKKISDINPPVISKRQFRNLATGLTAVFIYSERNRIKISDDTIREAVKKTSIKGRMEKISENPLIIIDGAHNEEAVVETLKEIKNLFPDKKLITLYSGMKDKEFVKIINLIKHMSDITVVTEMPFDRSIKENDVKNIKGITFIKNPIDGLEFCQRVTENNSVILITGSLYLIGEVLKIYNQGR
ncbi:bifunctional folylpolyglutamate synthase/dihydrofolate synthase [Persephonella sp.]